MKVTVAAVHLSDYERDKLSYSEHDRRSAFFFEEGTGCRASDIDVNGPDEQYF